jgi:hypothetical protein
MVDGSGSVVETLYEITNGQSIPFNTNLSTTLSLSVSTSVTEGTYYIKVMSRPHETNTWQECYDGEQYKLTAVISNDNLTITVPKPTATPPTCESITVNGDKTVGHELEVIASIIGGERDYHGQLFLYVNNKLMMGKTVDITAGQIADVRFGYTPNTIGDNTLKITTARSTNSTYTLLSTTVTIGESDATNTQTLTIVPIINNLADGKLYGNSMRVTARVTNPSTENSYVGKVNCSLREYDSKDADIDDYKSTYVTQSVSIAKNSTADVNFIYDGLTLGKYYRLRLSYSQGYVEDGKTKTRTVAYDPTEAYEMGEGYLVYNANGTSTILPTATTIDGGDALCLDLTSLSTIPDVTPSSNPNCIYLLNSDAEVPSALSEKNVVKGSTAATLTLTDGYDFHTPVTFTATNVSYTRTFTLAAAGTSGWNTIMLPFTVNSITCDGLGTVDWFHSSSDTGKNFWVKTFTGDAAGHVYFDFANEMAANTPYIIAVPDDRWGAAWQMTHKNVTFSGTDATIQPITTGIISGNNYRFCGSTIATTRTDGYALNDVGSNFARITADTDIPAFRAWIEATSISSLTMPALSIMSGSPVDGIQEIESEMVNAKSVNGKWLDLSGRSVQRPEMPGLYIVNGKKYIVK